MPYVEFSPYSTTLAAIEFVLQLIVIEVEGSSCQVRWMCFGAEALTDGKAKERSKIGKK
jgi:hypothetical protein